MAGQQLARDEAGHIWEVDANGQPLRLHSPAPAPRQGNVYDLPPDSLTAQQQGSTIGHTQAETTGQNLKNQVNSRTIPAQVRQAEGDAAKAELAGRGLDPSVRQKALAQWQAAQQLDATIADMTDKFNAGPGSTHGIWGIEDFFPSPSNQRFDTASNAARGIVRNALGLTGGEANTAAEAQMNLGAYIPQSSNFDGTIRDSIGRLQRLRDSARQQAIATLGGVPDANGNITPVSPNAAQQSGPPQNRDASSGVGPIPTGPMGTGPRGGGPVGPAGGPPSNMDGSAQFYAPPQSSYNVSVADTSATQQPDPAKLPLARRLAAMYADRSIPDDQIMQFATKLGATRESTAAILKFRRDNPNYSSGYAGSVEPLTMRAANVPLANQLNNAFANSPVGTLAVKGGLAAGALGNGAVKLVGGPDLRDVVGDRQLNDAMVSSLDARNPRSATAGDILGGVAGAGALEGVALKGLAKAGVSAGTRTVAAPIVGDAAFGGLQGASAAPDGEVGSNALLGATLGIGGGMFGRRVARGIGSAATGVQNESVRYLADKGIPLTFGQAVGQSGRTGAMIKGVEDRLTGLPFVGDMVNARRNAGMRAYNQTGFNEALAPIGATAPQVGEAGIDAGRGLANHAYGNTLDGVHFNIDPQFSSDIDAARRLGSLIPGQAENFSYTLDNKVLPNISDDGMLSGKGYQAARQALRADGKSLASQPRGADLNGAFGLVGNAFDGLADRQAPGVRSGLNAANQTYRNLSVLAKAVEPGKNTEGLFTPAQLATAGTQNAKRYGGALAGASEDRPFFDLARHGQNVLPSKVADSGTPGRLALTSLLSAPSAIAGGGAGYASGDWSTGAEAAGGAGLSTLAILAAGGNKNAQRLLVAAALNRTPAMVGAGQAFKRASPYAGMFGASVGAGLLGSQ